MKPYRVEFELGQTAYGQPLKLMYERDSAGAFSWSIVQEPANQRDDRQRISGLRAETLIEIAALVEKAKRLAP